MVDKTLISCVIPVFNGELFLEEALESVIAQTYQPTEIIVVDDGSTDSTASMLDRYERHITIISQTHSGAPSARNRGVEAAIGELIAFQDADDIWLTDKLSQQAQRLAENPEASICTCLSENFWQEDLLEEAERLKDTVHARPGLAAWPGMLVRRGLFQRVGKLDTGNQFDDVREWLYRAHQANVVIDHLDEILVRRRIHSNNLSRNRSSVQSEILLGLAERALAKRRAVQSQD